MRHIRIDKIYPEEEIPRTTAKEFFWSLGQGLAIMGFLAALFTILGSAPLVAKCIVVPIFLIPTYFMWWNVWKWIIMIVTIVGVFFWLADNAADSY